MDEQVIGGVARSIGEALAKHKARTRPGWRRARRLELDPGALAPPPATGRPTAPGRRREVPPGEREWLLEGLRRAGHNRPKAAQLLGLAEVMLHRRMRQHGLYAEVGAASRQREIGDAEKQRLVDALTRAGGSRVRAAKLLGVNHSTVRKWLVVLGLAEKFPGRVRGAGPAPRPAPKPARARPVAVEAPVVAEPAVAPPVVEPPAKPAPAAARRDPLCLKPRVRVRSPRNRPPLPPRPAPAPLPPPFADMAPEQLAGLADGELVGHDGDDTAWAAWRGNAVDAVMARRAATVQAELAAKGPPARPRQVRTKQQAQVAATAALMSGGKTNQNRGRNQWTARRQAREAAAVAQPPPATA